MTNGDNRRCRCVIVRGEKETFDFNGWVASRPDDEFQVAAITIAEVWHGIERATGLQRAKRQRYLEAALASLPVIAYTKQTAQIHARIWADLVMSGKMIGFYDLIVAATALEHGSEVATFNTRHFQQVRGLRVIEPK